MRFERSVLLVLLGMTAIPAGHADGADPQGHVASLVAAERAFARASAESGIREAFLANLDPESVLFRPRPPPGIAAWKARPATKARLDWRPDYAEVSAAGDLGFTAGPWTLRPAEPEGAPAEHGHFVTVWRKDAAGVWKALVDIGVSHAEGNAEGDRVETRRPGAAARGRDAREEIRERERTLAAAARSGLFRAFAPRCAHDVRLYREGAQPFVGIHSLLLAVGRDPVASAIDVQGAGASESGDLGYAYGVEEVVAGNGPPEARSFVRVWRRDASGNFRVALDVWIPAPPAPAR
jgi:ketosteroid isomerase-like protein